MYREMVANVGPQVDHFITVATGPESREYATGITLPLGGLWNISATWNMILDKAAEIANGRPYYVAILNDDALVADDWFDRMVEAMERSGTVGASTPRQPNKARSIFGGAFVIKGGMGIRLSGEMRHWYSDDEVQKLCQARGGFSIVPGVDAVNRLANRSTRTSPDLQAMNAEDWPKFKSMYGMPECPWEDRQPHVVISAPSGIEPKHILDTLNGHPYTVMVDGWETDQLAEAASRYSRFVFLKESVRLFPGFWERIDDVSGSCWLFARPSCFMGIYDARTLRTMLRKLPPTKSKQDSILNEWRIHGTVDWPSLWPDVSDANALRVERVNGAPELVIGNGLIEKLKGTARCGRCAGSKLPGVCEHLLARAS